MDRRAEERGGGGDGSMRVFDECVAWHEKDFNPSVNRGITAHRCLSALSSHPFIFPPRLPLTPTIGHWDGEREREREREREAGERSEELPSPARSPHAVFMVHYHSESWPISF